MFLSLQWFFSLYSLSSSFFAGNDNIIHVEDSDVLQSQRTQNMGDSSFKNSQSISEIDYAKTSAFCKQSTISSIMVRGNRFSCSLHDSRNVFEYFRHFFEETDRARIVRQTRSYYPFIQPILYLSSNFFPLRHQQSSSSLVNRFVDLQTNFHLNFRFYFYIGLYFSIRDLTPFFLSDFMYLKSKFISWGTTSLVIRSPFTDCDVIST